jgi:protoheme IX farnesyltransferase
MANNSHSVSASLIQPTTPSKWSLYLELCKPKVVFVMLITAWIGMALALTQFPTSSQIASMFLATLGISLCAGSSAVINHIVDHWRDQQMRRTRRRPVASGRVSSKEAMALATGLVFLGLLCLSQVNMTCLLLTLCATLGYAVFYTLILKPVTPQNITIGGIAGALPPLLGWTAISPEISPQALLLVLIIFTWTPPHFWALALYRVADYQKAKVPMLPVTHGLRYTRLHILLYSILLCIATTLPWLTQFSSWIYLVAAIYLNGRFTYRAWKLYRSASDQDARSLFKYSIIYLLVLFIAMLVDRIWFFWL